MSKFKVGDKVERIAGGSSSLAVGSIGTVAEVVSPLNLKLGGSCQEWMSKFFKLYKEPNLYPLHDIAIAWLEGEKIQRLNNKNKWTDYACCPKDRTSIPAFYTGIEYRIKPENPHADEISSIQEEVDKIIKRLEVLKDD